jgi:hypothetical protein
LKEFDPGSRKSLPTIFSLPLTGFLGDSRAISRVNKAVFYSKDFKTFKLMVNMVFFGFYQLVTWIGTGYASATAFDPGKGYWALVLSETNIPLPPT